MLAITTNPDGILLVRGQARDALELWQALRLYYLDRRPRHVGRHGLSYPATVVDEAGQVAQLMSSELVRVRGATGYERAEARWLRALDRMDDHIRGRRGEEPYPDNDYFWLMDTFRVAVYASAVREQPTRAALLAELVREQNQAILANLKQGTTRTP
jgi:hypothetical protein